MSANQLLQTSTVATGASPSPNVTTKKRLVRGGLLAAFLLFVLGGPFEHFLLGWIYFPLRVVPRMSVDWPTAVLGLLSCVAFVAGLHFTIRWFLGQTSAVGGTPRSWSITSTCTIAVTVVLMFAAGTAIVGATHQFMWLVTSRASHPGDQEASSQRRLISLLDAVELARDAARQTQTRIQLKYWGLAMEGFSVSEHGILPPGGVMLKDGTLLHGWPIFLMNFTSFTDHGKTDFGIPWDHAPNDELFKCEIHEFVNVCQQGPLFDERGFGLSHFSANIHVFPVRVVDTVPSEKIRSEFLLDKLRVSSQVMKMSDISDGTSNTIMLGTVNQHFKPWGHPSNVRDPALGINRSPDGFGGPPKWHGAMFLMCDGSVRMLNENIDPKIMQSLGTPNGGEQIPAEFASRYLK